MNSKDIIQFLKSEPLSFTYEEIEQMMDEELSKAPEEMDTDFVDLCANVLNKAISENIEKECIKHKRVKFTKLLVCAVIIVVAMGIAVPISAKYINNDTSDKIVKFYEDHFCVDFSNGTTDSNKHLDEDTELVGKLKDGGFDNIILPSALLNDYTYTVNITESESFLSALISFNASDTDFKISAAISKYRNNKIAPLLNDKINVSFEYDSAKQLTLNGMDVFVFGNKEYSTITYVDKDTFYDFQLINCNFDSAIEIAESIK
ncbi:MAG: hypothetical protein K2I14_05685 [Eubacterium sp.]|nr:hypothetical protein [Eubacterium sp.]